MCAIKINPNTIELNLDKTSNHIFTVRLCKSRYCRCRHDSRFHNRLSYATLHHSVLRESLYICSLSLSLLQYVFKCKNYWHICAFIFVSQCKRVLAYSPFRLCLFVCMCDFQSYRFFFSSSHSVYFSFLVTANDKIKTKLVILFVLSDFFSVI